MAKVLSMTQALIAPVSYYPQYTKRYPIILKRPVVAPKRQQSRKTRCINDLRFWGINKFAGLFDKIGGNFNK